MLRGKFNHCPSFFEPSEPVDLFHFVVKDIEDTDGNLSVSHEMVQRSSKTPFTPQTGIDVRIGDIAFMVRSNLKVVHEPSYLSVAKNGNPFEQYLAVQSAAVLLEKNVNSKESKK